MSYGFQFPREFPYAAFVQTFYEVGNALLQIRDERLYRQTHSTFEEYCREKWSKNHKSISLCTQL